MIKHIFLPKPYGRRRTPRLAELTSAILLLVACSSSIYPQGAVAQAQSRSIPTIVEPQPLSANISFSSVSGFRELQVGLIMISDGVERLVRIIDTRTGAIDTIARVGSGPREYLRPAGIFDFVSDSVLLYDAGNRRFLVLSEKGVPGRTINISERISVHSVPHGADSNGMIYFEGTPLQIGRTEVEDSVPVFRWDPNTEAVDTLGRVWYGEVVLMERESGIDGLSTNRYQFPQPFAPRDEWAVLKDGRIVVASPRVGEYLVHSWTEGVSRWVGSPIPVSSARVSEADKAPYTRGRLQVPWRWPEFKPPFGRGAMLAGDGGVVWLRREGSVAGPLQYDVLDANGVRVCTVQLPSGHHAIGFGESHIYAMREDENDLYWLTLFEATYNE